MDCVRNALVQQIKLIDEKYSIIECQDGLQALNTLKEKHNEIHFAIVDNQMPNMNGCQVIQSLREYEQQNQLLQVPILCIFTFLLLSSYWG